MARLIPLDARAFRYNITVTLEDVDVQLRLYWQDIAYGWYVDFYKPAVNSLDRPTPISTGHAIRGGGGTGVQLSSPRIADGMPPGAFVVTGPDDYSREELGDTVRLYYATAAEMEVLDGR